MFEILVTIDEARLESATADLKKGVAEAGEAFLRSQVAPIESDTSHFTAITPPDPNPFKRVKVKDGTL